MKTKFSIIVSIILVAIVSLSATSCHKDAKLGAIEKEFEAKQAELKSQEEKEIANRKAEIVREDAEKKASKILSKVDPDAKASGSLAPAAVK